MVLNLASDSNLKSQESDNLVDIVFFPQSQYVQYQTDFNVDILFQKQKSLWNEYRVRGNQRVHQSHQSILNLFNVILPIMELIYPLA